MLKSHRPGHAFRLISATLHVEAIARCLHEVLLYSDDDECAMHADVALATGAARGRLRIRGTGHPRGMHHNGHPRWS